MDIDYELGKTMQVKLNDEDIDSLATRGFCTYRKGLSGHETKTWIKHDSMAEAPRAIIDGDGDLNINIPPNQQFPFVIVRDAISAYNGDQAMVEWFFRHDDSRIEVA